MASLFGRSLSSIWKKLIQRCRGNLRFGSDGIRGCRVLTNFCGNEAGRIAQAVLYGVLPKYFAFDSGQNCHVSIASRLYK